MNMYTIPIENNGLGGAILIGLLFKCDVKFSVFLIQFRSRLRIEVRLTENDLTRLYKNGDISVVITCS